MHKCVRCKRVVGNIDEINDGCICGSKVFTFISDDAATKIIPQNGSIGNAELENAGKKEVHFQAKSTIVSINKEKNDQDADSKSNDKKFSGKAPESYFARMTFTTEDVENIKVMTQGVFLVDVNALSKNPVVLKDEEGIYYVKIPFEQNGRKAKKQ